MKTMTIKGREWQLAKFGELPINARFYNQIELSLGATIERIKTGPQSCSDVSGAHKQRVLRKMIVCLPVLLVENNPDLETFLNKVSQHRQATKAVSIGTYLRAQDRVKGWIERTG